MTDWSELSHAYGSAEDVPALLDRLDPDSAAPCWEQLWSRLCHQGTVYSASFAALPRLTEAAAGWAPEDRGMVLTLAASIVAGADQPHEAGDVRRLHAEQISGLLRLSNESLRSAAVAEDPGEYVYLLQAILAFEGVPVWDTRLEGLVNEEFEVDCTECTARLFLVMGETGFFACSDDYALDPDVKRTPLLPAEPGDLDGLAKRLHTTARDDGQDQVAMSLTYLFGTATCTECGTASPVAELVERDDAETGG